MLKTVDVVVQILAALVVVTSFLTASTASSEALKTANLLKSLSVNALISGEMGTGKKTLARYILPQADVLEANSYDEILLTIASKKELIITHIENFSNHKILNGEIKKSGVRVVATGGEYFNNDYIESLFSVQLSLPGLNSRKEDILLLQEYFLNEMRTSFGLSCEVDFDKVDADISNNAHSLKKQVYLSALLKNMDENILMQLMEDFLEPRLGNNNDYRDFLHLYEVPLIRSGLKKFKSQLQLSDKLGLNRNTLRKKMAENEEFGL